MFYSRAILHQSEGARAVHMEDLVLLRFFITDLIVLILNMVLQLDMSTASTSSVLVTSIFSSLLVAVNHHSTRHNNPLPPILPFSISFLLRFANCALALLRTDYVIEKGLETSY